VLITGVVHAAYFIALARCYERGDISVVYPVARGTGVAGAAAAGILLLGERAAALGVLGIVAICGGVLLISLSRPAIRQAERSGSEPGHAGAGGDDGGAGPRGRQGRRLWAEGLPPALLVGLIICSYTVVDKIGVATTDPLLYIYNMYLLSAVLVSLYQLFRRAPLVALPLTKFWVLILVVGFGSISAYLLVLFAFRIAPVSYAAAVREVSVVFGALLGFLLLGEAVRVRKILGILAILCGLALIRLA
jgi:drug/metabolite transporter (DMT)-like permease